MRCSRLMQSIQHHDHCRLDSRTAARGIGGSSQHEDDIGLCPAVPQSPDEDDVIKQAEEQMFQFDLDDQEQTDMNGGLVSPADAAAADDQDSDTEIKIAVTPSPSVATTPSSDSKQKQHNSSNQQHKIANHKLLSLLSKLDTSRGDYGYTRQKRAMREMSRARAEEQACNVMIDADADIEHLLPVPNGVAASMPATSYLMQPVISRKQKQSPVNFKFLSNKSKSSDNNQHNNTCSSNETVAASTVGGLKRSESAPSLGEANDITFTVSNVVDNSDESDPDDVAITVVAAAAAQASSTTTDETLTDQIKKGLEGEVAAAVAATAAESTEPQAEDKAQEATAEQQKSDNGNKYRRCSSLKSGKTPPGSPGKRKIVRFADLFGLDLSEIKTICDDIPKVPKSAFQDLKNAELSDMDSDSGTDTSAPYRHNHQASSAAAATASATPSRPKATPSRLQPLFTQPSGTPAMLNNLRDRKVSLESAYVDQNARLIKGIVRVVNFDFHKAVSVRYTTDDWASHRDVTAAYLSGTADGFSDRFSFVVDASGVFDKVGGRLQMCLSFRCLGNEYWDSNNGGNYVFQYFAGYQPGSQSRPLAASPSDSRQQQSHTFSQLSNSPTTFSDDPWLRYM